ncbi:MAG: hypothetical protein OXE87_00600 [Chloroflexi bacterium]|nr:hypothetical protein [Chloroflexota bacterium]
MTTPGPTLEERVTILETRFDTILPTLATKEDIARLEGKMGAMEERLEGKMDAMNERLEGKIEGLDGKIDAMGNRLLIRLTGVMAALLAIAVAAARFL